jgi:hypothetical protein
MITLPIHPQFIALCSHGSTMSVTARQLLSIPVGLLILLSLIIFDQWFFVNWFDTTYIEWYLANGALIGLVSSFVSMAWGNLDRHTGLISSHPLDYLGACAQFIGLPIYSLGTSLVGSRGNLFDRLVTGTLALALSAAFVVWFVVVVPLQYFVYLVCGGPGRVFSRSTRRAIARLEGTRLEVKDTGEVKEIHPGWWDASIGNKPVTTANLLSSLFFLVVGPILS